MAHAFVPSVSFTTNASGCFSSDSAVERACDASSLREELLAAVNETARATFGDQSDVALAAMSDLKLPSMDVGRCIDSLPLSCKESSARTSSLGEAADAVADSLVSLTSSVTCKSIKVHLLMI